MYFILLEALFTCALVRNTVEMTTAPPSMPTEKDRRKKRFAGVSPTVVRRYDQIRLEQMAED